MVRQLETQPILAQDLAAVMPSAQGLLSDELIYSPVCDISPSMVS
ncbi:hypothetical protein [Synechococcus sp. PCC 6312]|nr:hypothetical protein [Synechococcus sp. PCC 6312]